MKFKIQFQPVTHTVDTRARLARFSIVGNAGFVVEAWGVNAADAVGRYQDKIRAAQRMASKAQPTHEQCFTLSLPWSFQVAEVIKG